MKAYSKIMKLNASNYKTGLIDNEKSFSVKKLTFKRLKRSIINEFSLFYNLKLHLNAILRILGHFTPVEEVVIVHHTSTEIRLQQNCLFTNLVIKRIQINPVQVVFTLIYSCFLLSHIIKFITEHFIKVITQIQPCSKLSTNLIIHLIITMNCPIHQSIKSY